MCQHGTRRDKCTFTTPSTYFILQPTPIPEKVGKHQRDVNDIPIINKELVYNNTTMQCIQQEMRWRKLRRGVNCKGALKQKGVKQGPSLYTFESTWYVCVNVTIRFCVCLCLCV
jgi:hypothetical protein